MVQDKITITVKMSTVCLHYIFSDDELSMNDTFVKSGNHEYTKSHGGLQMSSFVFIVGNSFSLESYKTTGYLQNWMKEDEWFEGI